MRRRRIWLEIGIIVVGIAWLATWMRPKVEESTPAPSSQPTRQVAHSQGVRDGPVVLRRTVPDATRKHTRGLRFLGKNARGFEEYENLKEGTVLIKVPGATFTMGANDGKSDEKPPHVVTLPPYYIAKHDVTNSQFMTFVSESGYAGTSHRKSFASNLVSPSGPAYWERGVPEQRMQNPVVAVNLEDATAYCTWAGLRLPTEEEWELAARGTQGYTYPWGDQWDPSLCLNSAGAKELDGPVRIGSFPSGASPFGCLDMVGSVGQWTSSPYAPYPGNSTPNEPFGWNGVVARGGSYYHDRPTHFRGAARSDLAPEDRFGNYGFRCALSRSP